MMDFHPIMRQVERRMTDIVVPVVPTAQPAIRMAQIYMERAISHIEGYRIGTREDIAPAVEMMEAARDIIDAVVAVYQQVPGTEEYQTMARMIIAIIDSIIFHIKSRMAPVVV